MALLRWPHRLTRHLRIPLQTAEQRQCFPEPILLFDGCEPGVEVNEQVAEREQLCLKRSRIHSLAKSADHLFRHKTVKIPDRREMGIGITRGEFNRSRHTLQERSKRVAGVRGIRTWHPGRDRTTACLAAQRGTVIERRSQRAAAAGFSNFPWPSSGSVVE